MADHMFAPGCALAIYKSGLVDRLLGYLRTRYDDVELMLTCCRHTPGAAVGKNIINVCPGCDRRYRENYAMPSTLSLWEVLADSDDFRFPDYGGKQMTIIDACPTRDQPRIHQAVRRLAEKMNIEIIEPEKTRESSTCCGDTFHGRLPTDEVVSRMKDKAAAMPVEEVLVYCVSCSKSMFVGGAKPSYMVDLLFDEATLPGVCDPDAWHSELDDFIATHDDGEGTQEQAGEQGADARA